MASDEAAATRDDNDRIVRECQGPFLRGLPVRRSSGHSSLRGVYGHRGRRVSRGPAAGRGGRWPAASATIAAMSASTHEVAGRARQQPAWSSSPRASVARKRRRSQRAFADGGRPAAQYRLPRRPEQHPLPALGRLHGGARRPRYADRRRWQADRGGLPATIAIERFTPFTGHRFRPWGSSRHVGRCAA